MDQAFFNQVKLYSKLLDLFGGFANNFLVVFIFCEIFKNGRDIFKEEGFYFLDAIGTNLVLTWKV